MKILKRLSLLLLALFLMGCVSVPKPGSGSLDKISWGISQDELLSGFPTSVKENTTVEGNVVSYTINYETDIGYGIVFPTGSESYEYHFTADDKLYKVSIGRTTWGIDSNEIANYQTFTQNAISSNESLLGPADEDVAETITLEDSEFTQGHMTWYARDDGPYSQVEVNLTMLNVSSFIIFTETYTYLPLKGK